MKLSQFLFSVLSLAIGMVLLAGAIGPAAFSLAVPMAMVGAAIRMLMSPRKKQPGDR